MKILFISDTHCYHRSLIIDQSADIIIHSGDMAHSRNPGINANEMLDFIKWYSELRIPIKICIAGNHDTSIEAGLITRSDFNNNAICYLEHESLNVSGINIFGSPYTPTFGTGWGFNVDRDRIGGYWNGIPFGTNILVTHGPPYSILDLANDNNMRLEHCGDAELYYAGKYVNPKIHAFGHIHNNDTNNNQGIYHNYGITYVNSSVMTDGEFDKGPTSHGIMIEY